MHISASDRRTFFKRALALASLPAAANGTLGPRSSNSDDAAQRRQAALEIRQNAAMAQSLQPIADHVSNGDEASLPAYIASFTKGLPHTQLGEVQAGAYETLLYALSTGKQADF